MWGQFTSAWSVESAETWATVAEYYTHPLFANTLEVAETLAIVDSIVVFILCCITLEIADCELVHAEDHIHPWQYS